MKKTERPGIYKEVDGIVLNKDDVGLKAYKKRKELDRNRDKKIDSLQSELSEIKELLKQLMK